MIDLFVVVDTLDGFFPHVKLLSPNSLRRMSAFCTKQRQMMERKGLSVQLRRQSNEAGDEMCGD